MKHLWDSHTKPVRGLVFLTHSFRLRISLTLFFQVVSILGATAGYYLISYFIDDILTEGRLDIPLVLVACASIGPALVRASAAFLVGKNNNLGQEGIAKRLRDTLLCHIQSLSFAYHVRTRSQAFREPHHLSEKRKNRGVGLACRTLTRRGLYFQFSTTRFIREHRRKLDALT